MSELSFNITYNISVPLDRYGLSIAVITLQVPSVKGAIITNFCSLLNLLYCGTLLKYTEKQHFEALRRSMLENYLLFVHEGRAALTIQAEFSVM